MSHVGWIKLHRKILDHAIFKNDKMFRVFMYVLLEANHSDYEALVGDTVVRTEPGQLVTGRKAISAATGLTEQNVRTAISKLEMMGILTIKSTNKYSIISIAKWHCYQETNQQVTSSQPTSNQQVTTDKNGKKGEKGNKTLIAADKRPLDIPYNEIFELYKKHILGKCHAKGFFADDFLKNKDRRKHLDQRWLDRKEHQSVEFWDAYFECCSNVSWIRDGISGDKVCTIDMLVNKTKFYKFIEEFWA